MKLSLTELASRWRKVAADISSCDGRVYPTDLQRCADELEAALAQQAQPRCGHGETSYHDWGDDGPHDTAYCPGPQRAQPDATCDECKDEGGVYFRCSVCGKYAPSDYKPR